MVEHCCNPISDYKKMQPRMHFMTQFNGQPGGAVTPIHQRWPGTASCMHHAAPALPRRRDEHYCATTQWRPAAAAAAVEMHDAQPCREGAHAPAMHGRDKPVHSHAYCALGLMFVCLHASWHWGGHCGGGHTGVCGAEAHARRHRPSTPPCCCCWCCGLLPLHRNPYRRPYRQLVFRTLNRELNRPHHNDDHLAAAIRDELMPVRGDGYAVQGVHACACVCVCAGVRMRVCVRCVRRIKRRVRLRLIGTLCAGCLALPLPPRPCPPLLLCLLP